MIRFFCSRVQKGRLLTPMKRLTATHSSSTFPCIVLGFCSVKSGTMLFDCCFEGCHCRMTIFLRGEGLEFLSILP